MRWNSEAVSIADGVSIFRNATTGAGMVGGIAWGSESGGQTLHVDSLENATLHNRKIPEENILTIIICTRVCTGDSNANSRACVAKACRLLHN